MSTLRSLRSTHMGSGGFGHSSSSRLERMGSNPETVGGVGQNPSMAKDVWEKRTSGSGPLPELVQIRTCGELSPGGIRWLGTDRPSGKHCHLTSKTRTLWWADVFRHPCLALTPEPPASFACLPGMVDVAASCASSTPNNHDLANSGALAKKAQSDSPQAMSQVTHGSALLTLRAQLQTWVVQVDGPGAGRVLLYRGLRVRIGIDTGVAPWPGCFVIQRPKGHPR